MGKIWKDMMENSARGLHTWWLIFLMSMCIAGAYLYNAGDPISFGSPGGGGRTEAPDQVSQ